MLPTRLLPAVVVALGVFGAMLTGCTPKFSQKDVDRSGIALAQVRALVEAKDPSDTLIIDARGPSSYDAGHIPGAKNLPLSRFSGKYGETDPALEDYGTIVVYGDNPGSASTNALAPRMMSTGYDNVRAFFEGFDSWKRAGLAVEKSQTAPPPPPAPTPAPRGEQPKPAK